MLFAFSENLLMDSSCDATETMSETQVTSHSITGANISFLNLGDIN